MKVQHWRNLIGLLGIALSIGSVFAIPLPKISFAGRFDTQIECFFLSESFWIKGEVPNIFLPFFRNATPRGQSFDDYVHRVSDDTDSRPVGFGLGGRIPCSRLWGHDPESGFYGAYLCCQYYNPLNSPRATFFAWNVGAEFDNRIGKATLVGHGNLSVPTNENTAFLNEYKSRGLTLHLTAYCLQFFNQFGHFTPFGWGTVTRHEFPHSLPDLSPPAPACRVSGGIGFRWTLPFHRLLTIEPKLTWNPAVAYKRLSDRFSITMEIGQKVLGEKPVRRDRVTASNWRQFSMGAPPYVHQHFNYFQSFQEAVETGDTKTVSKHLAMGMDPNMLPSGETPLQKAIQKGQDAVVALLLRKGAVDCCGADRPENAIDVIEKTYFTSDPSVQAGQRLSMQRLLALDFRPTHAISWYNDFLAAHFRQQDAVQPWGKKFSARSARQSFQARLKLYFPSDQVDSATLRPLRHRFVIIKYFNLFEQVKRRVYDFSGQLAARFVKQHGLSSCFPFDKSTLRGSQNKIRYDQLLMGDFFYQYDQQKERLFKGADIQSLLATLSEACWLSDLICRGHGLPNELTDMIYNMIVHLPLKKHLLESIHMNEFRMCMPRQRREIRPHVAKHWATLSFFKTDGMEAEQVVRLYLNSYHSFLGFSQLLQAPFSDSEDNSGE